MTCPEDTIYIIPFRSSKLFQKSLQMEAPNYFKQIHQQNRRTKANKFAIVVKTTGDSKHSSGTVNSNA